MGKIRALRADEIEVRVSSVSDKGCQLLLYKDARCDKRILDETYGPMNWQDKYEVVKGNLFCSVGVKADNGEWVWKQDCGTESYTEKEKGEASDAFKRACFNWGIGRELYTKIFIWVPANVCPVENKNGKWVLSGFPKFYVAAVETDTEKEKITSLEVALIHSGKDMGTVFTFPKTKKPKEKSEDKTQDVDTIRATTAKIQNALKAVSTSEEDMMEKAKNVLLMFKYKSVKDVTPEDADRMVELINRMWADGNEG